MDEYKDESANMEEYIRKQDKKRSSYYNYFSQSKWGNVHNYHLSVNSTLGIEQSAKLIETAARSFIGSHK